MLDNKQKHAMVLICSKCIDEAPYRPSIFSILFWFTNILLNLPQRNWNHNNNFYIQWLQNLANMLPIGVYICNPLPICHFQMNYIQIQYLNLWAKYYFIKKKTIQFCTEVKYITISRSFNLYANKNINFTIHYSARK